MKKGISDQGFRRLASSFKKGQERKTLMDLAELVDEKEKELAYGSETSVLGAFVNEYDYVSSILSGDTDLDVNMDVTDAYAGYEEAYRSYEAGEEDIW